MVLRAAIFRQSFFFSLSLSHDDDEDDGVAVECVAILLLCKRRQKWRSISIICHWLFPMTKMNGIQYVKELRAMGFVVVTL